MHKISLEKSQERVVEFLCQILRDGGLAALPTDTVYGLIGDARQEAVIDKIHQFKNRPLGMGISIFVSDTKMAKKYVKMTIEQEKLITSLTPGKFTFILPSKNNLPSSLYDSRQTLGIRIIQNELINKLLKKLEFPLTGTSANLHGRSNISSSVSFEKNIPFFKQELIDVLLDGKCPTTTASTVVDLSLLGPKILRHGTKIASFVSGSVQDTNQIAKDIFQNWSSKFTTNVLFLLEGDLGSGKTVFAKQIAEILGLYDIQSPSYQIVQEYDLPNENTFSQFVHSDLYFLENQDSLQDVGLMQHLELQIKKPKVIVLEWGELGGVFLQEYPHVRIVIKRDLERENSRKIELFAHKLDMNPENQID